MKKQFLSKSALVLAVFLGISISNVYQAADAADSKNKPNTTRYVNIMFDKVDVEKNITYAKATDFKGKSIDLKLDVYKPSKDSAESRPGIVFVHGGGLTGGSKDDPYFNGFISEFAKRGYVVFSIDYRVRDNQNEYLNALKDAADDAALAVRWVINNSAKYKLDKKHIALLGHSVGSDIVNNLCYNNKMSDRLQSGSIFAAIDISGGALPLLVDGGSVRKDGPPCLVVHGTMDEYAPYEQAVEFSDALKQNGVEFTFLTLTDGTHLFQDDYYEILDTTVQFLYKELLGSAVDIRKDKQMAMEQIQERIKSGKYYKAKQIDFKADGDLSEWGKSAILKFDQLEESTTSFPSPKEFSGTAMLGWNEKDPTRIYLAATITDDVITDYSPADGWWRWVDDTLELRTDFSDKAVFYPLLWAIGANGDLSETAAKDNTECKFVRNGTTTTYEIAIDLSKVNTKSAGTQAAANAFKCAPGKMIAIGAYYDDTEVYRQVGWVRGWAEDRRSYVNVVFDAGKAK
jgi:acetyl esterase/lipase